MKLPHLELHIAGVLEDTNKGHDVPGLEMLRGRKLEPPLTSSQSQNILLSVQMTDLNKYKASLDGSASHSARHLGCPSPEDGYFFLSYR